MGAIQSFRLADILGIVEGIPPLGMTSVLAENHLHFVYGNALLMHLCGDVHPLEFGLAMIKARAELIAQYPWLAGECPPEGRLGHEDWAFNWAWVDTMERKHGDTHPVRSLPNDWRSSVPLTDFDAFDEHGDQIGYSELPQELQAILRSLGYSDRTS